MGHGVRWDQDNEVLRNTYRDLQKVNPGLKRNESLEKIVQSSQTCNIYRHEDHRDVDEKIKGGKMAVISCTSTDQGCRRGPGSGIPNDPLKVYLRFTVTFQRFKTLTYLCYSKILSEKNDSIFLFRYFVIGRTRQSTGIPLLTK